MTEDVASTLQPDESSTHRWTVWTVAAREGDSYADLDPSGGTPFLLAPDGTFDVELNQFFTAGRMIVNSPHTRSGYARDIATFLSFAALRRRDVASDVWRLADREDRRAYARWRNDAVDGPRVAPTTWNRESVAVYQLYRWALSMGYVRESPISYETDIQTRFGRKNVRRDEVHVGERRRESGSGRLRWLDGAAFRKWRDVGIRGLTARGERPTAEARSMSGRDVAYANLMVRTGLRLEEQTSLLLSDIPDRNGLAYVARDLSSSIAKNGSGRRVYYPDQILAQIEAYVRGDRAWAITNGRANGLYDRAAASWHIRYGEPGWAYKERRRVRLKTLRPADRRALLIETSRGFVPASLWLTRDGRPMTTKGWQGVFERANRRASRLGVAVRATPHVLRHSFAVATLEQLQRGHNERLATQSPEQRRHYQMVFGDPLNFLRLLLGHRSVETTSIYLHALAEIELEARLMLMNDDWGLPSEVRSVDVDDSHAGANA